MISTIHPTLEAGTAASIQLGSVVFPVRYPAFPGPAILAGRDGHRFLIWPNNGVRLEEVEFDHALLRISADAHLDIDERSQVYLRKDETAPQAGMVLVASGKDHPLLLVQGPVRGNLVVSLKDWTVQAMPTFVDIAFTRWSVWPSAMLGRVNDRPFFEVVGP